MDFWSSFTRLAETNFALSLAALLTLWLCAARAWRLAAWWCVLFGGALFVVTATKVAYAGWGIGIAAIDFRGFSGHAMRAAAIAPVFAFLLAQRKAGLLRQAAIGAGVLFAIGIAISRLVLAVHSVSEVVSGLALGFAAAWLFIRVARQAPMIYLDRFTLVFCAVLLLPVLTTRPAPTQGWIEQVAVKLAGEEKIDEIRKRMGRKSNDRREPKEDTFR